MCGALSDRIRRAYHAPESDCGAKSTKRPTSSTTRPTTFVLETRRARYARRRAIECAVETDRDLCVAKPAAEWHPTGLPGDKLSIGYAMQWQIHPTNRDEVRTNSTASFEPPAGGC